jgi:phage shock protein A
MQNSWHKPTNTMNVFKRLTIQVRSSVEELLNSIENHEAVSEAAIREYQQNYAKAKVRLDRLVASQRTAEKRLESTEKEVVSWKTRATKLASEDRTKAMECLKRMKAAEAQLTEQKTDQEALEASVFKLRQTLESMRRKIDEAKRKRDQLVIRDSSSKAVALAEKTQLPDTGCDGIFERWEEKVICREVAQGEELETVDSLEHELIAQEEDEALSAELDALINETK